MLLCGNGNSFLFSLYLFFATLILRVALFLVHFLINCAERDSESVLGRVKKVILLPIDITGVCKVVNR